MEEWPYRRCAFCRQMIDPREPDELAHHARGAGHQPMPGIPDDGLETIPLDFSGAHGQGWAAAPVRRWQPKSEILPYRTARPRRRRRGNPK